jgi:hypothetical protein
MTPEAKAEANGQGPPWAVEFEDYERVLGSQWRSVWTGDGGENALLVVWERK